VRVIVFLQAFSTIAFSSRYLLDSLFSVKSTEKLALSRESLEKKTISLSQIMLEDVFVKKCSFYPVVTRFTTGGLFFLRTR
jgi:hypothetical protein